MSRKPEFAIVNGETVLPTAMKASWGAGALGMALLMNCIGGLILFYLTTIVGMSAWMAGTLLAASRVLDAVNDPLMGMVSDKTPEKYGSRRRPYLLVGGILSAITMILCFNVPFEGDSWAAIAYVSFALIFYGTAYSMFNVPFISMPAEMTDGYHERSSIHGWRVIFAGAGLMLAGGGAGVLLGWLSDTSANGVQMNDQADYTILSLIYALVILIACLTAWHGTRHAPYLPRSTTRMPFKEQLRSFFNNRFFLTVMGVKCLQLIALYASQAATFFMIVEVLQRPSGSLMYISMPMVITSLFATPLLIKIARRTNKRVGYMISALFTAAAYISWTTAQIGEPDWALALRGVLLGVGFSGNVLFAMSMVTDAIEWDSHRTGLRREGMYTSVFSFVEKIAGAVGPAVVGAALSLAGFDKAKTATDNSEAVREATLIGIAYIPATAAFLSALLLLFYKLDEKTLRQSREAAAARNVEQGQSEE